MRRLAIAATLLCLGTAALATPATPDTVYTVELAAAKSIQSSYTVRDGAKLRAAITKALARFGRYAPAELDAALAAYRAQIQSAGVKGLESLVLSATSELASRGGAHEEKAFAAIGKLAAVYRLGSIADSPHALVGVTRASLPVIRHLPILILRRALERQLVSLTTDLDAVLAEASCTSAALADAEARYGKSVADRMRALCQGLALPPSQGGTGVGFAGGLSELSCLFDHAPTRAERVGALTRSCLSSIAGTTKENPFTDGGDSVYARMFPLHDIDESNDQVTCANEDCSRYTFVSRYDASQRLVETVHYDSSGRRESFTYYDPDTSEEIGGSKVTYGANGDVESVTLTDEDGTPTWKVEYGTDENGDATVDVTAYDEDGRPIPEDGAGQPDPTKMPAGDGWGDSPECRELTLALIEERVHDDLMGGGYRPRGSVSYPHPEAPVTEDAGAFDCFSLPAVTQLDKAFQCRNALVHCAMGYQPDATCVCRKVEVGVTMAKECQQFITCEEGRLPVSSGGQCTCEPEDEAFIDETSGLGGDPRFGELAAPRSPAGSPLPL
jgi:hypothetical protein